MSFKRFKNYLRHADGRTRFEVGYDEVVKALRLPYVTKRTVLGVMFRDPEAFTLFVMYKAYARMAKDDEGFVPSEALVAEAQLVAKEYTSSLVGDRVPEARPIQQDPISNEGESL